MPNNINPATPVSFDLPDGDSVALIPWEYVAEKLNEGLTPALDSLELINTHLTAIDNKLDDWLPSDGE